MGRIFINGNPANIPTSLSEITLRQRIAYQREHGDELDEMLKGILEMDEGFEKEIAVLDFIQEKAVRTASFFMNTTVEAIRESEFVDDILNATAAANKVLFEQEDEMELEREFLFKGELWEIPAIELLYGDKRTTRQYVQAKQTVQNMIGLGANNWECLQPLAAFYLLKKGEKFNPEFVVPGSERQEMMLDLQMDIVMQISFFFLATMNIYLNTFQSSSPLELKDRAEIRKRLSSSGAGWHLSQTWQRQSSSTLTAAG